MGTTSGVFMLVPGAMALRSVSAILGSDVAVGLQLTAEVLTVAISIGALPKLLLLPKTLDKPKGVGVALTLPSCLDLARPPSGFGTR